MRNVLLLFVSSSIYFSACCQPEVQHRASIPDIQSTQAPLPCEEGDIKQVDFNVNKIALVKSIYSLRGNGITICLKENSPDASDIDLRDNLVSSSLTSSLTSDHATTIATIIAGAGNSSPRNEGIAPQAKIIGTDFNNLLPESTDFYLNNHVSVINHSYGTTIENFYGANALAYDQCVVNSPGLLHIFSSGNLGYAPGTGKYEGLSGVANLTGNFKQAKNILTVGAINELEELIASSSSGPAYDGRLKPELCAYSDAGTSDASALVSGTAALMQELFMKKNDVESDAALLKSILINAADDVGPAGLDWRTGFGSLNAFRAIQIIDRNQYSKGILDRGQEVNIPIQIPIQARNLKVTLAWTDPVATINSNAALVNDLDLEITASKTWQPWVLNSYPHADSLQKAAVRGRDGLNNVEQVTIENPAEGSYNIHVVAYNVKEDQQVFYVSYQWDVADTLYWISPVKNETVIDGDSMILRWKSTLNAEKGTIELTTDQGQTWSLVQADVLLADGKFEWTCPGVFSRARFRMVVGGSTYSTEDFLISPVTIVTMLYQCADSLRLSWHTETNEDSLTYHLYQYENTDPHWTDLGLLTGNAVTLHNNSSPDIFAVKPLTTSSVEGMTSDALMAKSQNVYCFYKNVTATFVNDSVQVACELSTTDDVATIVFQKNTSNGILSLDTLTVFQKNVYYFTQDVMLQEGYNVYRVQINLSNGKAVYSDFVSVLVFNTKNFFVFPNPVDHAGTLTINARQFDQYTIQLYDAMGLQVYENKFYDQNVELPLTYLAPGVYVYRIFNVTVNQTGRIILK